MKKALNIALVSVGAACLLIAVIDHFTGSPSVHDIGLIPLPVALLYCGMVLFAVILLLGGVRWRFAAFELLFLAVVLLAFLGSAYA